MYPAAKPFTDKQACRTVIATFGRPAVKAIPFGTHSLRMHARPRLPAFRLQRGGTATVLLLSLAACTPSETNTRPDGAAGMSGGAGGTAGVGAAGSASVAGKDGSAGATAGAAGDGL